MTATLETAPGAGFAEALPATVDYLTYNFDHSVYHVSIIPTDYLLDQTLCYMGDRMGRHRYTDPKTGETSEFWRFGWEHEYLGLETAEECLARKREDCQYPDILEDFRTGIWYEPIYISVDTHPDTLQSAICTRNGHHRLAAAVELGMPFVPVSFHSDPW